VTTRARVCHGVPSPWSALAATGPLLASPGWLRAMRGRLGDETMTVVVDDDGVPRSAFASAGPLPGEFFDHRDQRAPGLPLTAASRAARAALVPARTHHSGHNLVVMLPGYGCVRWDRRPAIPPRSRRWSTGRWTGPRRPGCARWRSSTPDRAGARGVLAGRSFVAMPLSISWDLPVPPGGVPDYWRRCRVSGASSRAS
jgi:hypothetical protein